jgi:hypothetical protein
VRVGDDGDEHLATGSGPDVAVSLELHAGGGQLAGRSRSGVSRAPEGAVAISQSRANVQRSI